MSISSNIILKCIYNKSRNLFRSIKSKIQIFYYEYLYDINCCVCNHRRECPYTHYDNTIYYASNEPHESNEIGLYELPILDNEPHQMEKNTNKNIELKDILIHETDAISSEENDDDTDSLNDYWDIIDPSLQ